MELATFGCTFFRITSPEMCKGLVSRFGPILHYMVMNRPSITAERFCGISLQSSGCTTTDPESHWRIDISQYSVVPVNIDPPVMPRQGKLENVGKSGLVKPEASKTAATEVESTSNPLGLEVITPRRRSYAHFDPTIPVSFISALTAFFVIMRMSMLTSYFIFYFRKGLVLWKCYT